MNQLSFPGFIWKNLCRRRLRILLTVCGMGIAIGSFAGLVGFSNAFEQAWLRIYTSSGTDIAIIRRTFLNTSMNGSVEAKVRALPFVAQISPTIDNGMDLTPELNASAYRGKADSCGFGSLQSFSGQAFKDHKPEVMPGYPLADELKKNAGDTMDGRADCRIRSGVARSSADPYGGAS